MKRVLLAALTMFMGVAFAPLASAQYNGYLDGVSCSSIGGWAWDGVNTDRIDVQLFTAPTQNGTLTPLTTVVADQSRPDLAPAGIGDGYHAFSFPTPPSLIDNQKRYIYASYGTTKTYLIWSGSTPLTCSPSGPGPYTFSTTTFTGGTIDTGKWTQVGSVAATSGIGFNNPNSIGGALLLTQPMQGSTTDYEVNETLTINGSGDSSMIYLRATPGSLLQGGNTGTYNAVVLSNVTCSGANCTATLYVSQSNAGTITQIGQTTVPCHNGTSFRAVAHGATAAVYIDNIIYLLFAPITPGGASGPGIGMNGSGTNGIANVGLGVIDTVAPNAVNAALVKASLLSNQVDLQWEPVLDNQGGIGIAYYDVYRNGAWVNRTTISEFVDTAVSPGTNYTYTIVPIDYHLNGVVTNIPVATAPANAIDGRQIGVRTTGTYWGAGGEQLDMRSGNLNFSQPLLKPMGRGGWGVSISLSYNSQNWRLNSAATWMLGADIGYGFGWTLQAGSLTAVYRGYYLIDHFVFTDASGAQYVLDQNNGGVWSSKSSVYVWYDTTTSPTKLHFPDGSFWEFACQSAGTEQDAGTAYPTLMEDSNGNQITITYNPGIGVTWPNSSARIQTISDVRKSAAYTFTYTQDWIPHLATISNSLGTAEAYSFVVVYGQPVNSPFSGQPFYGTTNLLQSVTQTQTNLTTSFSYDQLGIGPYYATSGELAQVTFPYGGYLRWAHNSFAFSDQTLREVKSRYLAADGHTEYSYSMDRPTTDAQLTTHSIAYWNDVSGNAEKLWTFQTDGSQMNAGLALSYSQLQLNNGITLSSDSYTWAADSVGRPYIGTIVSTLDPGQTYSVKKQSVQTVDQYGNLLTQAVYNYGAPGGGVGTLARTYTNTYMTDAIGNNTVHPSGSNYGANFIFNRLVTSTVADGTNTAYLASNAYDMLPLINVTGMTAHDTAYTTALVFRGNPTAVSTLTTGATIHYDIGGSVSSSTRNGVTTSTDTSTNAATNYAAPSLITTNTLSTSLSWSGFLGLSGSTGPNGDAASIFYDGAARPSSTTSPTGAVTTFGYASTGNPVNTATINGHWTKTQLDGFGRTQSASSGYGTGTGTTVSTVDTVYLPCGCSPLGKVAQVSQPYAPGGTKYWTTYVYDSVGRTKTVTLADNSATSYLYKGNTVTVTDAAGHAKTFTMDAFGNLTTVQETDPQLGLVSTAYTYDVVNHLIGVSMPRGTITQTRSFNYNVIGTTVTGYLQSATNPENGTVSYTYANGLVATKTDAKNQQIQYSYDTYNRLSLIKHFLVSGQAEDTSQRVTFIYDSNTLDTSHTFSNYTAGRLAAVSYGPENNSTTNPLRKFFPAFAEWYNYTQSGLVSTKRLQLQQSNTWNDQNGIQHTNPQVMNFDAGYTYDTGGEGKILSVTYPTTYPTATQTGALQAQTGSTYTYSFDSLRRPAGMTDQAGTTDVSNVVYNAANQLTSINYFGVTESRTYNTLNQLTGITSVQGSQTLVSQTYTYPGAANIGKISQVTDGVSGEVVQYTYDSLNRLITAATTSTAWGQSYTYDGFGNLTAQNVTQGSAPHMTLTGNSATNQFGGTFDANGNLNGSSSYVYDVENRLSHVAGGPFYAYDAQNRRVWQWNGVYNQWGSSPAGYTVYFYGINGQRLASYQLTAASFTDGNTILTVEMLSSTAVKDTYFAGRRLQAQDRLGSAAIAGGGSVTAYYPYGQAKGTQQVTDNWAFATYWEDSATGLDDADQRYYSSSYARFATPDPSGTDAVDMDDPGSWNGYIYVGNDPVNFNDPSGLLRCGDIPGSNSSGPTGRTFEDILSTSTDYGLLAVTIFVESAGSASNSGAQEMAAIGAVIINRYNIVNSFTQLMRADGTVQAAPAAWGNADKTLSAIINPNQFQVWQGDGGTLTDNAQSRLDYALNSDANSTNCQALENAYYTALDDLASKGKNILLTDDKTGLAYTGFNSFRRTQSYSWERYIGQFGSANKFYGVQIPLPVSRHRPPVGRHHI